MLPSAYPVTNFFVTAKGVYFTPRPKAGGTAEAHLVRFVRRAR
jgi:hypothetical protein